MKTATVTKGSASLVYFYYGDSKFITLCQETLKLAKAFEGYDRKVLLKHQETPSILDFSEKDEKVADVMDLPTKANFFKHIRQLAEEGFMTDVYIFSHGSTGSFRASKGKHGQNDVITKRDIETELGSVKTGFNEMPIRMVWGTICYGSTLNETWRKVGAKVVGLSRFTNFFPNQFGGFIRNWNKGDVSFQEALEKADTAASRTLVHTYILGHALGNRKDWGGCPALRTVLGKHPCSKAYFTSTWLEDDSEYRDDLTGKENMILCSEKIIAGQGTLRKQDKPVWK